MFQKLLFLLLLLLLTPACSESEGDVASFTDDQANSPPDENESSNPAKRTEQGTGNSSGGDQSTPRRVETAELCAWIEGDNNCFPPISASFHSCVPSDSAGVLDGQVCTYPTGERVIIDDVEEPTDVSVLTPQGGVCARYSIDGANLRFTTPAGGIVVAMSGESVEIRCPDGTAQLSLAELGDCDALVTQVGPSAEVSYIDGEFRARLADKGPHPGIVCRGL